MISIRPNKHKKTDVSYRVVASFSEHSAADPGLMLTATGMSSGESQCVFARAGALSKIAFQPITDELGPRGGGPQFVGMIERSRNAVASAPATTQNDVIALLQAKLLKQHRELTWLRRQMRAYSKRLSVVSAALKIDRYHHSQLQEPRSMLLNLLSQNVTLDLLAQTVRDGGIPSDAALSLEQLAVLVQLAKLGKLQYEGGRFLLNHAGRSLAKELLIA